MRKVALTNICSSRATLICACATTCWHHIPHYSYTQVFALWPEWQADLPEALRPATAAATTAAAAGAASAAASTDAAGSQEGAAPPTDDDAPASKRQKTAL
jgi:hypothetical protein